MRQNFEVALRGNTLVYTLRLHFEVILWGYIACLTLRLHLVSMRWGKLSCKFRYKTTVRPQFESFHYILQRVNIKTWRVRVFNVKSVFEIWDQITWVVIWKLMVVHLILKREREIPTFDGSEFGTGKPISKETMDKLRRHVLGDNTRIARENSYFYNLKMKIKKKIEKKNFFGPPRSSKIYFLSS